MQAANFIVREPLVNAQGQVLGYELTWQRDDNNNDKRADRLDERAARALVDLIAEPAGEAGQRDYTLFLETHPALLREDVYAHLPRQTTVLTLHADDLADKEMLTVAKTLRARGFGIALRGANLAEVDKSGLSFVSHLEVPVDSADLPAKVERLRALDLPSLHLVARDIGSWEQYDLCSRLGMEMHAGDVYLAPRAGERLNDLNPTQTMIIQLMEMVKKGEDVRQLENLLKRDAAVSYKLLRYINSAGFGLGCEVQSLRHAVTLLGYSPLYRWLALLLVTANDTESSPVLLQTAVIRGRFAELLGQGFLPRSEGENLFVAGMFSLLDRLLCIPMDIVLEKIPLSAAVTEALLSRQGIFGPFLALAEACEVTGPAAESMASSLCISPRDVNAAHLSALAWVQNLRL